MWFPFKPMSLSTFYPLNGCVFRGRECHEIVYFYFFAQNTLPGPHMNRLKRFGEVFRFREAIQLQGLKFAGRCSKGL